MKKLLFFDIDGTPAYPRSIPTPETVSAIRRQGKTGAKLLSALAEPSAAFRQPLQQLVLAVVFSVPEELMYWRTPS